MNISLMGIPFCQEEEIHEHFQVPLLLRRRTKGNLAGFEKGFLQKIFDLTGRNGRLKPGKSLNLIGHIGNKTR